MIKSAVLGKDSKMSKKPSLEVVIVNWNAGEQLHDCMRSLQAACNSPFLKLSGCIVVDNASTDVSLAQLSNISIPYILIRNSVNRGFAYACNQGAKQTKSEYILFLNPDVRLSSDSLTKSLNFMEETQNKQIGILGIQLFGSNGVHRNTARFSSPKSIFYQMLGLDRLWPNRYAAHFMTNWNHNENREVDQVPGAFFLVRREVFDELRGFDEQFFMYYEDLDFAYRARQAGWKSYYLANVQAYHAGGGTTNRIKAKRHFYVLRSRVYYIAKHFGYKEAVKIVASTIAVEFWIRLTWSLLSFSVETFIETLQAYIMFAREAPRLVRDIKSKYYAHSFTFPL